MPEQLHNQTSVTNEHMSLGFDLDISFQSVVSWSSLSFLLPPNNNRLKPSARLNHLSVWTGNFLDLTLLVSTTCILRPQLVLIFKLPWVVQPICFIL